MPGPQELPRGNIIGNWLLSVALSPTSVAPNTTSEQTFTINGLQVGDYIEVNKPTLQAGLAIVNSRVSTANTLAIGFGNLTSDTITPTAAEVYEICVTRANNVNTAGSTAMSQIV